MESKGPGFFFVAHFAGCFVLGFLGLIPVYGPIGLPGCEMGM